MKHFRTLTRTLVALTAATTLAACGDEKDDAVTFTVTPQTVTIQDGSTPAVSIQTNAEWFVSMVTEPWLTATPMSGSGNAMLTISATGENSTREARSAQIAITERKSQQVCVVNVTQLPPTPVLIPSTVTVELASTGGETSVTVTANIPWTASSDQTWCTVTPATSSGTLAITAQPNIGERSRTAMVTLTAMDGSAQSSTITVTQQATLFNVTPQNVTLSQTNNNTATINVETTAEWSVTSISESWLAVTPAAGEGNVTLTVKASVIEGRSQRTATVTLKEHATGREQTVSVTQLPPPAVLTTDKQSLSLSHGAGNEYVAVMSNVGWTVRSSASWCTVTPSQGSGNGSIIVSVTRNEAFTQRKATLTITPDESSVSPVSIEVIQAEYVEIRPGEEDNITPQCSRQK